MYLNCHSYYSLRYGTLSPEQLVEAAVARGIRVLALTDIHRTSGIFDFVQACTAAGIKPVVGMEFSKGYICLARNPAGLAQINTFATQILLSGGHWPDRPPEWADVWTIFPYSRRKVLRTLGPNERWGVRGSDLKSLWNVKDLSGMLWCQPVTFLNKQGFSMHRLLRAIDQNVLLSKLSPKDQAQADERFYSPEELREVCRDYPGLLEEAERLLADCTFSFDLKLPKNRKLFGSSREDDLALLTKLACLLYTSDAADD